MLNPSFVSAQIQKIVFVVCPEIHACLFLCEVNKRSRRFSREERHFQRCFAVEASAIYPLPLKEEEVAEVMVDGLPAQRDAA
jgi:hypothetical protein